VETPERLSYEFHVGKMDAKYYGHTQNNFPESAAAWQESRIFSNWSDPHLLYPLEAHSLPAATEEVSSSYLYNTPMSQYSSNQPLPRSLPSEPQSAMELVPTQHYPNGMDPMLESSGDIGLNATRPLLYPRHDWRDETLNAYQTNQTNYPVLDSDRRGNSGGEGFWSSETLYDAGLSSHNYPNVNESEPLGYCFPHSFPPIESSRELRSSTEMPMLPDPSSESLMAWTDPNTQVSQDLDAEEYKFMNNAGAESLLVAPRDMLPSQNAGFQEFHPMSHSTSSQMAEASPTTESTSLLVTSPPTSDEQRTRDEFLIRCRQNNISYKDIKEQGGFQQSIPTLRGRYRNLTKDKRNRLRKPKWTQKDVRETQTADLSLRQGANLFRRLTCWIWLCKDVLDTQRKGNRNIPVTQKLLVCRGKLWETISHRMAAHTTLVMQPARRSGWRCTGLSPRDRSSDDTPQLTG